VNLTAEQRTKVQQTVLAGSNVPRVNNVSFSVAVGTAVPASVRVVDVPPTLIEIYPEWRGHRYFVVHDDIIIVDRSRKIVAVVPVGSSARGGAQLDGSQGALSLSSDQIRRVQVVLIEKGFDIGEPDGLLGPRTKQALISFQRQQGFAATGQIDSRTVTALGLSNMTGQRGGAAQPSTSGQGGAGGQQPPAGQDTGAGQQGNQGAGQPSTTGQGDQGATRPSGQGSEKMQRSPDAGQGSQSNRPADQSPQGR
jgi:peptidoglycan hydrolase-like protein with peptidoglycan-binding domain